MATTRLITAEDLFRMEEGTDRLELIRGELRRMPPAGGEHGEIGQDLAGHLWLHVRTYRLGKVYSADTGFVIERGPDTVLAPDIAYIRADRLPPKEARAGFLPIPPDLAVEVLSPSERAGAIAAKVALYLGAGVRLVWLIRPRTRTIEVHHADGTHRILRLSDELDGGDVVPGFQLPVAELFHDEPCLQNVANVALSGSRAVAESRKAKENG